MTSERTVTERTETHSQDPNIRKVLECARAAIEKKAENVKVLDLSEISGFTDYFVVCSGLSDRQIQSIADSVQATMESQGHDAISVEGYAEGRWVLMDFGDVIVHIFLDALREYYDLEALWADAPNVKVPSEYYGPAASRLN